MPRWFALATLASTCLVLTVNAQDAGDDFDVSTGDSTYVYDGSNGCSIFGYCDSNFLASDTLALLSGVPPLGDQFLGGSFIGQLNTIQTEFQQASSNAAGPSSSDQFSVLASNGTLTNQGFQGFVPADPSEMLSMLIDRVGDAYDIMRGELPNFFGSALSWSEEAAELTVDWAGMGLGVASYLVNPPGPCDGSCPGEPFAGSRQPYLGSGLDPNAASTNPNAISLNIVPDVHFVDPNSPPGSYNGLDAYGNYISIGPQNGSVADGNFQDLFPITPGSGAFQSVPSGSSASAGPTWVCPAGLAPNVFAFAQLDLHARAVEYSVLGSALGFPNLSALANVSVDRKSTR